MDKERATIFIKNKIADLKDDLDHEECVERDELSTERIRREIEDYKNVLDVLVNNREDSHDNATNFIWGKISVLEDLILCHEDKVKKYMFKCDLEEYNNIKDCLLTIN